MKTPVYMDYHATTPVDPRVLEAMLPYFTETFGNASSRQHSFGWKAEEGVEAARAATAAAIGCEAKEIIFTSGSTEGNNLAIKGVAGAYRGKGDHIVTVQTEHKSVLDTCKRLEKSGMKVTYLGVDGHGVVDPGDVRDAITPATVLVSVMTANNEIGTIQDIAAIGAVCRERGVLFHTDATQAVGRIPVDVRSMNIDLLSLSAHKIYGPKGIGALFVRSSAPRVTLAAQTDGGGHERGLRSGTLNVPGIVGLGSALAIAAASREEEYQRTKALRDRMLAALTEGLDDVYLNGHPALRLPNNLNLSFLRVDENALMMSMKDVAVSTGSACSSSTPEPSHVLRALHLPEGRITSAIRFGLGRMTTDEEASYVTDRVLAEVRNLRSHAPSRGAHVSPSVSLHYNNHYERD